jgi:hypothetical protein
MLYLKSSLLANELSYDFIMRFQSLIYILVYAIDMTESTDLMIAQIEMIISSRAMHILKE